MRLTLAEEDKIIEGILSKEKENANIPIAKVREYLYLLIDIMEKEEE